MNIKQKYFSKEAIIGLFLLMYKAIPAYIMAQFLKFKSVKTPIWLIGERPEEARDNGYYLFKYIIENNKEIEIYYIINKHSIDRYKLEQFTRNIIYFGSYKHYIYYFLAERHINSHGSGYGCMPNMWTCRLLELIVKKRAKNIFIQHGITKDIMPTLFKKKTGIDLFVCGGMPEYKFIKDNFGYLNEEVQYLGLCRFDNLHDFQVKNQIMYMPTWRKWLANISEEQFKESEYYLTILNLINSEDLIEVLETNNTEFVVCLHPMLQKYIHLLTTKCKKIIIASTQNYDIQNLLKESSLLITDYSSVYFDFAYMKKPIIYYQFDYLHYRNQHFKEGYFQYSRDGFGPVVTKQRELISEITKIIHNNYKTSDIYLNKIIEFFPIYDKNNCERNFKAILNL